ncbi:DEK carboxy-terminal domain protein [Gregarina niphandrodes]|uniref:DEK carboxy-terminal domain protein n=1 Tax=Gregarina niphandrodes TaxID=110365 RepID=A0A023AYS8_GRENI|nr:DEK carboxy-terminal domain protein [Gregarina niphandrodes]EZG43822.1 DEK carboxy-terminal domain protein [Gregarina niphandrodes]|eukprot:XP_011132977.1 DEK carboxy-terminal domain protein [Gregarina niphandrodes]
MDVDVTGLEDGVKMDGEKTEGVKLKGEKAEEEPLADMSWERITDQDLENGIRGIVNSDNITSMTKRILRHELEQHFGLPENSLLPAKDRIKNVLTRVVNEVDQVSPSSSECVPRKKRVRKEAEDSEGSSAGEQQRSAKRSNRRSATGPMTKAQFMDNAVTFKSQIGPVEFDLAPRKFSTGSCGWFYGSKHDLMVGDVPVTCRFTLNCIALGSKNWPNGKSKVAAQSDSNEEENDIEEEE